MGLRLKSLKLFKASHHVKKFDLCCAMIFQWLGLRLIFTKLSFMSFSEKLRELGCYSKLIHHSEHIWALALCLRDRSDFWAWKSEMHAGHCHVDTEEEHSVTRPRDLRRVKHGMSGDGLGYVLLYCIGVRGVSNLSWGLYRLWGVTSGMCDLWGHFVELERQPILCLFSTSFVGEIPKERGGGGGGGDTFYIRDNLWIALTME